MPLEQVQHYTIDTLGKLLPFSSVMFSDSYDYKIPLILKLLPYLQNIPGYLGGKLNYVGWGRVGDGTVALFVYGKAVIHARLRLYCGMLGGHPHSFE